MLPRTESSADVKDELKLTEGLSIVKRVVSRLESKRDVLAETNPDLKKTPRKSLRTSSRENNGKSAENMGGDSQGLINEHISRSMSGDLDQHKNAKVFPGLTLTLPITDVKGGGHQTPTTMASTVTSGSKPPTPSAQSSNASHKASNDSVTISSAQEKPPTPTVGGKAPTPTASSQSVPSGKITPDSSKIAQQQQASKMSDPATKSAGGISPTHGRPAPKAPAPLIQRSPSIRTANNNAPAPMKEESKPIPKELVEDQQRQLERVARKLEAEQRDMELAKEMQRKLEEEERRQQASRPTVVESRSVRGSTPPAVVPVSQQPSSGGKKALARSPSKKLRDRTDSEYALALHLEEETLDAEDKMKEDADLAYAYQLQQQMREEARAKERTASSFYETPFEAPTTAAAGGSASLSANASRPLPDIPVMGEAIQHRRKERSPSYDFMHAHQLQMEEEELNRRRLSKQREDQVTDLAIARELQLQAKPPIPLTTQVSQGATGSGHKRGISGSNSKDPVIPAIRDADLEYALQLQAQLEGGGNGTGTPDRKDIPRPHRKTSSRDANPTAADTFHDAEASSSSRPQSIQRQTSQSQNSRNQSKDAAAMAAYDSPVDPRSARSGASIKKTSTNDILNYSAESEDFLRTGSGRKFSPHLSYSEFDNATSSSQSQSADVTDVSSEMQKMLHMDGASNRKPLYASETSSFFETSKTSSPAYMRKVSSKQMTEITGISMISSTSSSDVQIVGSYDSALANSSSQKRSSGRHRRPDQSDATYQESLALAYAIQVEEALKIKREEDRDRELALKLQSEVNATRSEDSKVVMDRELALLIQQEEAKQHTTHHTKSAEERDRELALQLQEREVLQAPRSDDSKGANKKRSPHHRDPSPEVAVAVADHEMAMKLQQRYDKEAIKTEEETRDDHAIAMELQKMQGTNNHRSYSPNINLGIGQSSPNTSMSVMPLEAIDESDKQTRRNNNVPTDMMRTNSNSAKPPIPRTGTRGTPRTPHDPHTARPAATAAVVETESLSRASSNYSSTDARSSLTDPTEPALGNVSTEELLEELQKRLKSPTSQTSNLSKTSTDSMVSPRNSMRATSKPGSGLVAVAVVEGGASNKNNRPPREHIDLNHEFFQSIRREDSQKGPNVDDIEDDVMFPNKHASQQRQSQRSWVSRSIESIGKRFSSFLSTENATGGPSRQGSQLAMVGAGVNSAPIATAPLASTSTPVAIQPVSSSQSQVSHPSQGSSIVSMPENIMRPPPLKVDMGVTPEALVLTPEQRKVHMDAAREAFRIGKLTPLGLISETFGDKKQIAKQWANAIVEIDNVYGGICISVLLPEAISIYCAGKQRGKKGNKVKINVQRAVEWFDWYANDENSTFEADIVLSGMVGEFREDAVSYVYDNDYGVLFVYVEQLRSLDTDAYDYSSRTPLSMRSHSLRSPRSLPSNTPKSVIDRFSNSVEAMFSDK